MEDEMNSWIAKIIAIIVALTLAPNELYDAVGSYFFNHGNKRHPSRRQYVNDNYRRCYVSGRRTVLRPRREF